MPSSSLVEEESKVPLLDDIPSTNQSEDGINDIQDQTLAWRVWIESKKMWQIVGPTLFFRLASYSMVVITQAFAGHLGDLELAAISIAYNVILGFDFGLLVILFFSFSFFSVVQACIYLCNYVYAFMKFYSLDIINYTTFSQYFSSTNYD